MTLDLKSTLLRTNICKYLDDHELDILLSYSKVVEFASGEFILYQGRKTKGVYVILYGQVSVTAKVVGASVIKLANVPEGDFVGEASLPDTAVSSVSVVTQAPTQCIFIPHEYFAMLTLFSPETKYKINKSVAEDTITRLKNMHKKVTTIMKESQMTSLSLFGEVMHGLTRPKVITLEEAGVNKDHLKQVDFFNDLSDEDFTSLLKHIELFEAPRHCTLINEGEKHAACYFILRGAVQSRIKESHKIAKLSVLPPKSIFCCSSLIDDELSIVDFTTCERTLFFKISEAHLEELKKNKMVIWYHLYDAICKSFVRLEQAANRLDLRLHSELYNR